MKKLKKYQNIKRCLKIVILAIVASCKPTKHIPENKYLLDNYEISIDNKSIPKSELDTYLKQKPNKRVLGIRYHLRIYNLSNQKKDNGFNRWLRNIGEEPVILDEYLARKTSAQLSLYLKSKGYYHAKVSDSIAYKKKNAKLYYNINAYSPLKINNIKYKIEDTLLSKIILSDSLNTLIKPKAILDIELFDQERERIELLLKNKGYYEYTKQYMHFEVDSSRGNNLVDVVILVDKFLYPDTYNKISEGYHKVFKINNIYINPLYNPKAVLTSDQLSYSNFDTLEYQGIYFVYKGDLKFNKDILTQSVYLEKNKVYSTLDIQSTYSHLSSLRLYKQINIYFEKEGETNYTNSDDTAKINCFINLTPSKTQSYSFELEGTNSSGNLGGAANLVYQHKNLLNSFEVFDYKISGAFEALRANEQGYDNSVEFGTEANLDIQKFWLPFKTERFIKKYNPKTTVNLSYNYQRRPIYTGTIGNLAFGYKWKGSKVIMHRFNPIELNLVNIPVKSDTFVNQIKDTYLEYSYNDHVITATSYSFTFNNQDIRRNTNSLFFRIKAESAGNILTGYNNLFNSKDNIGDYKLFRTEYSQYLMSQIDLRYYNIIDENRNMAYKLFIGVGYPYGNSNQMPFEKQYFAGGANSIRAWKMRTIGPGSYNNTEDLASAIYPNQSADIKLEGSAEYRFKLFWLLEGALFLDIGNIWIISKLEQGYNIAAYNRDGLFRFNKFYKDLAIGTGFGARFDFSFFIFRTDIGLKLRDPVIEEKNKWIINQRKFNSSDLNVTIGIGYPF